MAIIFVFFISANTICLHCTTKMNKLLHKLSHMICSIIKSSSQLNPLLFLIFLVLPSYWPFMLLLSPLSPSFALCRSFITALVVEFALSRLVLPSNHRHHIPSISLSWKVIWSSCCYCFIAVIQSIVLLRRSGALSVYRSSPAAVAMDFALDYLMLYHIVRLFDSLIIVALLWRFEALSVYRLPLAIVVVEFTLVCLLFLSNCHSCIWFALLNCKVIRSFCCCCFVAMFRHSICVNVSWTPPRLRLRVDWKGNRSLNTSKRHHGRRGCSPFVSTQSHFSPNSSPTLQIHSVDLPLVYLSNVVHTSSFFCRLNPPSTVISTQRSARFALPSRFTASIDTTSPPISRLSRVRLSAPIHTLVTRLSRSPLSMHLLTHWR